METDYGGSLSLLLTLFWRILQFLLYSRVMNDDFSFFITCPLYAEDLLEAEVTALGGKVEKRTQAGVFFTGSQKAMLSACLWSRVAQKVLLLVARGDLSTQQDLYDQVRGVDWKAYFSPEKTLSFSATLKSDLFNHTGFVAQRGKDAVVDYFRDLAGTRPSVDKENPDVRLHLHLEGTELSVYFDLSGLPLFKRGYRHFTVTAPLKETTAAAVLLRSGWKTGAQTPFFDPFCGSGTLLLEAALIAGDIAPGFFRTSFGFFHWNGLEDALWTSLLDDAEERKDAGRIPPVTGTDMDPGAVEAALKNIRSVGLESAIDCSCGNFLEVNPPFEEGFMVTNPPYGERLGTTEELSGLYSSMGPRLIEFYAGWKVSLLNSSAELDQLIGLKRDSKHRFYNGKLLCTLSHYTLFKRKEDSKPFDPDSLPEGERILYNRLQKRMRHLGKWARRCGVTSYRIYDRDLPEYNVAIDTYEGRWIHISEYVAPADFDPAKASRRLRSCIKVVRDLTGLPDAAVFVKQRKRQTGKNQYGKMDNRAARCIIQESGCRFYANFTDYLDTGIFLDHRLTRAMLGDWADGKSFLNLFCYTGTATAIAARGGAVTTTSVDASNTYLSWARENMELNGFTGDAHRFYRSDCIQWLRRCRQSYDLIFIDPPTFSNSKDKKKYFDVQKDYVELLNLAADCLSSEGFIVFSNNFRRFKMDEAAFPRLDIKEISGSTIPEDFKRDPRIHRCWIVKKS